jgi:hypothetical protein
LIVDSNKQFEISFVDYYKKYFEKCNPECLKVFDKIFGFM